MTIKKKLEKKRSLEFNLLLKIAQSYVSDDAEIEVLNLLKLDINWYKLIKLAHQQGMLQILKLKLKSDKLIFPEQFSELIDKYFYKNIQKNLFLFKEQLEMLNILKNENIEIFPFKGPILSFLAYSNVAIREFNSIDFFVQSEHLSKIHKVLEKKGYYLESNFNNKNLLKNHCIEFNSNLRPKLTFINKNGIRLNIRWKVPLTDFYLPYRNFVETEKMNLIDLKINDSLIKTFSPEMHIILLCIDDIMEYGHNLSKLLDILNLIENQDINWPLLYETSIKLGVKKIVSLNLRLIEDLFGVQVVTGSFNLNFDSEDRNYYHLRERLLAERIYQSSLGERVMWGFGIRDSYSYGIRDSLNAVIDSGSNSRHCSSSQFKNFFKGLKNLFNLKNNSNPDYKFFPTDMDVVKEMLKLAEITSDDVVYDLGCGDGRVIVEAAREYQARGVGVDIDPVRIKETKDNIQSAEVNNLVKVINSDIMDIDISPASVIIFYLPSSLAIKVQQKIKKEAASGTRIVSYSFEVDIEDWFPFKTKVFTKGFAVFPLYLWKT